MSLRAIKEFDRGSMKEFKKRDKFYRTGHVCLLLVSTSIDGHCLPPRSPPISIACRQFKGDSACGGGGVNPLSETN
jgi:hypothetical protein